MRIKTKPMRGRRIQKKQRDGKREKSKSEKARPRQGNKDEIWATVIQEQQERGGEDLQIVKTRNPAKEGWGSLEEKEENGLHGRKKVLVEKRGVRERRTERGVEGKREAKKIGS